MSNDSGSRDKPRAALTTITVTLIMAALLTVAGSRGGLMLSDSIPVFAGCAGIAFVLQWIAFIPAYLYQTERYYDLMGAATYLTVTLLALLQRADPRALLLAALIGVWALRLGSFLFFRIRADGNDRRFDRIKPHAFRFLQTWTLQGLWVLVTAGAALSAMTSVNAVALGLPALIGALLWLIGFLIEVIADGQKRRFRRDPGNRGQFIRGGLWAWSRHPNYFGEMLLWCGIAVIAAPALHGLQLFTLVSPLFVYLLLTRVSGIPLLEAQAQRRWGDDPEFQRYRRDTPALLLRPPRVG